MSAQTAADIRAAMALIDTPDKWCRNVYRDGDKICMQTAIWDAVPGRERQLRVRAVLTVRGVVPSIWQDDLPGTHNEAHAEVIARMERAAQEEERTP